MICTVWRLLRSSQRRGGEKALAVGESHLQSKLLKLQTKFFFYKLAVANP